MTDSANQAPEDLGAPQSYLVLADGTAVYDRSGDRVGTVDHVLSDDGADVFHGLVIKTADGQRFAPGAQVDGIFEHGVIIAVPASELPTPSADAEEKSALRRAWDWIIEPK